MSGRLLIVNNTLIIIAVDLPPPEEVRSLSLEYTEHPIYPGATLCLDLSPVCSMLLLSDPISDTNVRITNPIKKQH